jgi:hypothetical protein
LLRASARKLRISRLTANLTLPRGTLRNGGPAALPDDSPLPVQ